MLQSSKNFQSFRLTTIDTGKTIFDTSFIEQSTAGCRTRLGEVHHIAGLLEKYGVALTFEEAATVLKYCSLAAAKFARQRGTFPIAIRKAGDRHLCSAADVASFLDGVAVPLSPPTTKPRRGRPTKAMVMVRQERKKNKIAAAIAKGRRT